MVMGIDLELCVFEHVDTSNMWILHAFSQIYFIFQGSQENHSMTLNKLRNIFPAAAFEKPIIRHYTCIHVLFCNKLQ